MKKFAAILLALCMVLSMAACGGNVEETKGTTAATTEVTTEATTEATSGETSDVMTHEEYMAAEADAPVCIEAYVQGTQSWWNDQISVYAEDENGGYFIYNMVCSEEDAAKLTAGAKIQVTGYKAIWSGLHEIAAGATFTFVEGAEPYVAEAEDVTSLLAGDMESYQGRKVSFSGMTIEASQNPAGEDVAFLYNWDGSGEAGGDSDLYFKASVDGKTYTFVIEYYLCNESTEAYQAVQNLKVGDIVDMEGYVYWYEGIQPHVTSVTVAE